MKNGTSKPVQIILVDDHNIVRRGLAALLQLERNYQVVAEADNGEDALRQADQVRADVMILDLSMPRLNGLEATRRLKKQHPEMRVLVLSMYDDEEFVTQALQAGACGYILKQSMEDELFQALDVTESGDIFVSSAISETVIQTYLLGYQAESNSLTSREREILQLIAEGLTTNEISDLLSISPHTTNRHRANLMKKMGVRNQAELVRLAIERNLVVPFEPPRSLP